MRGMMVCQKCTYRLTNGKYTLLPEASGLGVAMLVAVGGTGCGVVVGVDAGCAETTYSATLDQFHVYLVPLAKRWSLELD